VEVKERPGSAREVTALALTQLGQRAQLRQQWLKMIKVFLRRVPHVSRMILKAEERKGDGPGEATAAPK
jgi:hypothetical protein